MTRVNTAEFEALHELPPIRVSLRVKLITFAALIALLAGGVPATFLILKARRAERDRISSQLEQLGSTIAGGTLSADGRGALDARALRSFVANAASLRLPLAYVIFVGPDGRVDTDRSAISPDVLIRIDPQLSKDWIEGRRDSVLDQLAGDTPIGTGHRSLWVTIKNSEKETIGRLRIGMSTAEGDRRARTAFIQSGLMVGGVLLGSLLLAVFISAPLVRPLRRLVDAMGRVAAGNLEVVAEEGGSDEVGQLSAAFNVMTTGLRQRERLRTTLGRYISDEVAERLLAETDDLDLAGETRTVTVLFLDMREFSSMSENQTPAAVFELLNAYLELIVDSVSRYDGVINKFIGDAIMAVWGAPRPDRAPEQRAVGAAWEIQKRVGEFNWKRHETGELVINVGIGINTGEVVAGNVGTEQRMEYTVIGHTVNMAQRFESAAGPGQILISDATYLPIKDQIAVRQLPPTKVKGMRDEITLYEVTGVAGDMPPDWSA